MLFRIGITILAQAEEDLLAKDMEQMLWVSEWFEIALFADFLSRYILVYYSFFKKMSH